MERLIVGDPKSIKIRDEYEKKVVLEKLKDKVKCPWCGAMNTGEFEVNFERKKIGWKFGCEAKCPNSIQYAEINGNLHATVFTDFNGKFLH